MSLSIGDPVPDFEFTIAGVQKSLKDFAGQKLVLYFYPKDDTPGCTIEACDLRDNWGALQKAGVTVLGVSRDSMKKHDKFREKYNLPFPLIADEDGTVCQRYGVWGEKSMFGKKYFGINRVTFLIGEDGRILHIWPKVKVIGHVKEILKVAATPLPAGEVY